MFRLPRPPVSRPDRESNRPLSPDLRPGPAQRPRLDIPQSDGVIIPGEEIPNKLHFFVTGELTETILNHIQVWADTYSTNTMTMEISVWWNRQSRLAEWLYQTLVEEIKQENRTLTAAHVQRLVESKIASILGAENALSLSPEIYERRVVDYLRTHAGGRERTVEGFLQEQDELEVRLRHNFQVKDPLEFNETSNSLVAAIRETQFYHGDLIRANDFQRILAMREEGGVGVDWFLLPALNSDLVIKPGEEIISSIPSGLIGKKQWLLASYAYVHESYLAVLNRLEDGYSNPYLDALALDDDGTENPDLRFFADKVRERVRAFHNEKKPLFIPAEFNRASDNAVIIGAKFDRAGFIVATPRNSDVVQAVTEQGLRLYENLQELERIRQTTPEAAMDFIESVKMEYRELTSQDPQNLLGIPGETEQNRINREGRFLTEFDVAKAAYLFQAKSEGNISGYACWELQAMLHGAFETTSKYNNRNIAAQDYRYGFRYTPYETAPLRNFDKQVIVNLDPGNVPIDRSARVLRGKNPEVSQVLNWQRQKSRLVPEFPNSTVRIGRNSRIILSTHGEQNSFGIGEVKGITPKKLQDSHTLSL